VDRVFFFSWGASAHLPLHIGVKGKHSIQQVHERKKEPLIVNETNAKEPGEQSDRDGEKAVLPLFQQTELMCNGKRKAAKRDTKRQQADNGKAAETAEHIHDRTSGPVEDVMMLYCRNKKKGGQNQQNQRDETEQ
jgi:hypothetical protein